MLPWDISKRPGLEALLEELKKRTDKPQWTLHDFENWYLDDKEKSPATTADIKRHLEFMSERYKPQPVMLHGTLYQFVLSGRLYYKVRKVSKAGHGALKKDLQCLKAVSQFLGLPDKIWPNIPPQPKGKKERVPTPEEVYAMLHTDYTANATRSIPNAWAQAVLAFYFGYGTRPQEAWFLKRDWYDPDSGILHIVEPKKLFRERDLYVEPTWLAKSKRHLSLDNWLRWRAKIRGPSTAMFPNPKTGRDFPSAQAFKNYLDDLVKAKFPWFHPYLARHWCCYARIIEGGFTDSNYNQVAEWFGHDSVDMTRETYGPSARAFAKSPIYGEDWLIRAFQKMPVRRIAQSSQNGEPMQVSPVTKDGSARTHPSQQEGLASLETPVGGMRCVVGMLESPLGVAA